MCTSELFDPSSESDFKERSIQVRNQSMVSVGEPKKQSQDSLVNCHTNNIPAPCDLPQPFRGQRDCKTKLRSASLLCYYLPLYYFTYCFTLPYPNGSGEGGWIVPVHIKDAAK